MSAINSYCIRHIKKWSLHPLIFPVGLGLPCNTDKGNEQTPLGCIAYHTNTNQEERSFHYSDITLASQPTCEVSKFTGSE